MTSKSASAVAIINRFDEPKVALENDRMSTGAEIMAFRDAEPFRPFRIHMASGRAFDVRHPEMIRVGRIDVDIFTFPSDEPEVHDHWDAVAQMLIESISHLSERTPVEN